MNSVTTDPLRAGRLALIGMVALAAMLLSVFAGSSRAAETHTITIDNGRLTMGYVFLNNQILPADVPGPLGPVGMGNSSPNGTIKVEVDGSTATVSESDFKMPVVWIPDPTAAGAPIPMTFGPAGDLAGSWDASTGRLALTGTLRVNVFTGFDGGGPKICQFNAPGTTWTTDPNAISPGIPFNTPQGLDGTGALSVYWTDLADGVSINGGACGKPNAVVHDPGAVWLSSGVPQVPAPPTCQEQGLDGLWPDCVAPEFPDPDPVVDITRVQVAKGKVRAGKSIMLAVKVTNAGDKAANGLKLTLKSNNKQVKVARSTKISVPAGATATLKVKITAVRRAKGKAFITATAAGRSGKGQVTIQLARKPKMRKRQ